MYGTEKVNNRARGKTEWDVIDWKFFFGRDASSINGKCGFVLAHMFSCDMYSDSNT